MFLSLPKSSAVGTMKRYGSQCLPNVCLYQKIKTYTGRIVFLMMVVMTVFQTDSCEIQIFMWPLSPVLIHMDILPLLMC